MLGRSAALAVFVLSSVAPRLEAEVKPSVVGPVSHLLLPTSANVAGRFGAYYKTKISIFNATNATYTIRAGFSQEAGEVAARGITIGPYETLTSDNFVDDVFGLTGGGAIDLQSPDDSLRFVVVAQVYTDSPSGRYITPVQFGDDFSDITPGHPGFVIGLSSNNASRINVGCASNSSLPQTISFFTFNTAGQQVGSTFGFDLEGFGWKQFAYSGVLTNGGVVISATRNAVCFAVEVNNASNDGTFQLAVPYQLY